MASGFVAEMHAVRHVQRLEATKVEELTQSVPLDLRASMRLCFVGGKGGVGKTSVSGAIATKLSEGGDKVLIVSTDPAHSLFDSLGVESAPQRTAVAVSDCENLYALEIDAESALDEWKAAVEAFDVNKFGERYGQLGVEALRSLGVDEFLGMLTNPPPGIDELVALSEVIKLSGEYDKIVVDTAPTGHALRLLDLPKFADGFVTKVVSLRLRLGQLADLAGGALGTRQVASDVERLANRLERLRDQLSAVRAALADEQGTEFVIVTIPTALAARETERLARTLASGSQGGGVHARSIVVNKVIEKFDAANAQRYAKNQRVTVASALAVPPLKDMSVTTVPFIDEEVVGEFALTYFGQLAFKGQQWESIMERKLIVCGGKGGVGKTTTAAAMATWLSLSHRRVAIVSTDPAHSLGDALDCRLAPGRVVQVSTTLDALEIDAKRAAERAADLLKASVLKSLPQLADLAEALETPPPGVDELVGLLDILDLLKSGDYDHIVVDTAPTGHTLRMLSLPEILDDFAEKAANARDRIKRNPLVKAAIRSLADDGKKQAPTEDDDTDLNVDRLRGLQDRALALDAVLHDPTQCEFVIVCAPTDLSMLETARLKRQLDESQVSTKRLVVNGVLKDDPATLESFAAKRRRNQAEALESYNQLAASLKLRITHLPQFDTDVSGVWGVKTLAVALFRPKRVPTRSS